MYILRVHDEIKTYYMRHIQWTVYEYICVLESLNRGIKGSPTFRISLKRRYPAHPPRKGSIAYSHESVWGEHSKQKHSKQKKANVPGRSRVRSERVEPNN